MTKDTLTRNLKHKLDHDQSPMDFNDIEDNSDQQKATIDKATSYCQHCFDKSIEWFQVNEQESITLCLNQDCSAKSRITYDTNNNNSKLKDESNKKFKYSKEILDMTASELRTFFEKDIKEISCYKKLQTVLDGLSHAQNTPKQAIPETAVVALPEALPEVKEIPAMSQEMTNIISQNDLFGQNSNSMPLIGTGNDQYFDFEPSLTEPQVAGLPNSLEQLPFELPVFNQSESQATSSTIPASTFDDDFLALLNEDLTFTDLTKTYTNSSNNYQVIEMNPTSSFHENNTFNQEPITSVTSDLTELKSINHSEFMLEFHGDINLISGNTNSLTPVKNVSPTVSHKTADQSFEVIQDIGLKSGSRIKITKKKKKTAKQSMFDHIELEDDGPELSQDSTKESKYDSIGENEDSSDHLLPWEVKSSKKKKESTYQKRISNLGLMSMSRSSPQANKKPASPATNIVIPTNVTRADLSMKSSQSQAVGGSSVSLKKALSEASENSFQTELEKTSKISHLFNKSSLLKPPAGAGAGGYKDLVLNVLKKKTQA